MTREKNARRDWTVKELAKRAGLDPSSIRHYLIDGDIIGYKRGRDWFVSDQEARRWLAGRE